MLMQYSLKVQKKIRNLINGNIFFKYRKYYINCCCRYLVLYYHQSCHDKHQRLFTAQKPIMDPNNQSEYVPSSIRRRLYNQRNHSYVTVFSYCGNFKCCRKQLVNLIAVVQSVACWLIRYHCSKIRHLEQNEI